MKDTQVIVNGSVRDTVIEAYIVKDTQVIVNGSVRVKRRTYNYSHCPSYREGYASYSQRKCESQTEDIFIVPYYIVKDTQVMSTEV